MTAVNLWCANNIQSFVCSQISRRAQARHFIPAEYRTPDISKSSAILEIWRRSSITWERQKTL
ncbi:hypothetical protein I7I48_07415 [Histoplasma ohiense]|nr:hypothetical protein I7I48_07415 [Histoplasma ohiense (nom. inval.)]